MERVGSKRRSVKALVAALGCMAFGVLPVGQPAAAQEATTSRRIVVLGDSLSAGYGLAQGTGWVALLDKRIKERKLDYSVANASISGDTTAGGRSRLPAVLARERPAIVILELGANDALRGLSLASSETNLKAMIEASQAAGAKVLLVGMRIPPNYGPDYSERFFATFGKLAQQYHVPLVPFLLDGVVQRQDWFQEDRIHPVAAAQPVMLDNVWPKLEPLLKRGRGH
ncbi:Esterase TesA precursor [Ralstonia mannitolilytica]|uniref:Esterase TesA n=2 Tax=Burkholderiaceae TaxID=119060 RepID=A0AAJ5D4Q4_9RALS|nr:Esterase TesA [Ralstonia mannitolilytica]CAJ0725275.1 Esterase TesA [Ralstonia mannitolilytica]SUD87594.1 Esterase TesA precursor [Ralstonia mannitolilytica]SUD93513.1 Esterase TesA precursor [Ralstonia mannitolilytica]SUD97253.1 Esterase TesA precursor [Ralstonia mannitolilytica]